MTRIGDWSTRMLTGVLHRVRPSLPVVSGWPGIRRLASGSFRRILLPAYRHSVVWIASHRRRRRRNTVIGVTEAPPEGSNPTAANTAYVVVGLGNPGDRYAGTPHNVGQRALSFLAEPFGATWSTGDDARLCRIQWRGATVYLVQPLVFMNNVGPVLSRLAGQLPLAPTTCILVHDDLDLPVGRIRTRLHGGDGGHRGVRSVLHAFQTDTFPRVKIGVGRPAPGQTVRDYVLSPFAADQQPVIDQACRDAADRVLEMIGSLPSAATGDDTPSHPSSTRL